VEQKTAELRLLLGHLDNGNRARDYAVLLHNPDPPAIGARLGELRKGPAT
jgi:hypothetical protein